MPKTWDSCGYGKVGLRLYPHSYKISRLWRITVAKSVARAVSSPGVLRQEIAFPPNNSSDAAGTDAPESFSFWEQLYQVPEGEWWNGVPGDKGFRVYLYDQEQGGKYLEVIAHPFDIEWVKD